MGIGMPRLHSPYHTHQHQQQHYRYQHQQHYPYQHQQHYPYCCCWGPVGEGGTWGGEWEVGEMVEVGEEWEVGASACHGRGQSGAAGRRREEG